MQRNLSMLCQQIENSVTKEELYGLLNIVDEKVKSHQDRLIDAMKACDKLFESQPNTGEFMSFKFQFRGATTQGNRYVVENDAHFDLNDELYLNCLKKINKFYYQELLDDQNKHPALLFHQNKSQVYVGRTEQMYYSDQLNVVLSSLKQVLLHQNKCEVNPTDIFTELCSPDNRYDVLKELATRVKNIFFKKTHHEMSIMKMWDINHSERVTSDVKIIDDHFRLS